MRKTTSGIVVVTILSLALTAQAGSRTLTHVETADAVDEIKLDAGIGDIEFTAVQGADDVLVEVVLTPRRGGLFSSKRKAERDVAAASLKTQIDGSRLVLGINPPRDDDERRFEERWTVAYPSHLAVTLEHGVGDIHIRGTLAGVEIDSGVGDIKLEARTGNITIDLGVGTAVVVAPASAYAGAEGAAGVGEAHLTVLGEQIESGGFISDAVSWKGEGTHRIEVSVGVGDAVITLE